MISYFKEININGDLFRELKHCVDLLSRILILLFFFFHADLFSQMSNCLFLISNVVMVEKGDDIAKLLKV